MKYIKYINAGVAIFALTGCSTLSVKPGYYMLAQPIATANEAQGEIGMAYQNIEPKWIYNQPSSGETVLMSSGGTKDDIRVDSLKGPGTEVRKFDDNLDASVSILKDKDVEVKLKLADVNIKDVININVGLSHADVLGVTFKITKFLEVAGFKSGPGIQKPELMKENYCIGKTFRKLGRVSSYANKIYKVEGEYKYTLKRNIDDTVKAQLESSKNSDISINTIDVGVEGNAKSVITQKVKNAWMAIEVQKAHCI